VEVQDLLLPRLWQFISYQNMKFVVFRDQTYGMHLKQINGFDNNFIENIAFVNCNIDFINSL
jgi:hypothetical protein